LKFNRTFNTYTELDYTMLLETLGGTESSGRGVGLTTPWFNSLPQWCLVITFGKLFTVSVIKQYKWYWQKVGCK